ncbi:MAG: hypothetical protein M3463_05510 [Verrucomicrobiota bacterium]|nr:hypothetical protein [Verrucomicrobiota bacterium]
MNENKSTDPTPEQLLKIMDAELLVARSRRPPRSGHRPVMLAAGLLLILVALLSAFLVLRHMLADFPRSAGGEPAPAKVVKDY